MKILVTGASGFIGRNVCGWLASRQVPVRAAVRSIANLSNPIPGVEYIAVGDVNGRTDWSDAGQSVSHIIHLVGVAHRFEDDESVLSHQFEEVNHQGTRRLAEAALQMRSLERLINLSSSKAICNPGETEPDSDYGRSKLKAESAVAEVLLSSSVDWCSLRPCMVYGPSNLGNIVRLIVAIEKGLPLPLGAIRNQRSFLFIGNLVAAIEATLQDPQASRKVYAISDGEPISTPELVKMIGRYGNKDARVLSVPVWMLRILGKAGDVASVLLRRKLGFDTYAVDRLCESAILDDTAIRNELGFISPFSTEEGICHTMSQNPSAPMEYFRHLMNKSKVRA